MANKSRRKRKTTEPDGQCAKRSRVSNSEEDFDDGRTAGKIKRIHVRNFMCHDSLEVQLNSNVNFIIGRNGSGKSAILTALVVGLGAKANATKRGSSVKEFIKKGRNSATIDITLFNEGAMAYKPEVYGDSITVSRTIGSATGYRIKNSDGAIISTKKEELENIISHLNIQVENPISILNQDISRTFLVTAGPKEKYELFMKATHLDKIGTNYKNAQISSNNTKQKLNESMQRLAEMKKEIDELEKSVRMLESIDGVRAEHDALKNELRWSIAIAEEHKLNQIRTSLEEHQNNVENHKEEIKTKAMKEKQISEKIKELNEKIKEVENEAAGSSESYNTTKKKLLSRKEVYGTKARKLKSLQANTERDEKNIAMLRQEIERQEGNQAADEKRQVKTKLAELEKKLVEVDAILHTKQTEQMHHEGNRTHLLQEERTLKRVLNDNDTKIREKKKQIDAFRKEPNNAVTVFGPNMPRLLNRIKEEYDRGKFKEMPRGPLGSHMKMKDPAWAPAVESFLGAGTLRSFCVDNAQDAKTLSLIMKEVFRNEHNPQIIASKFYPKVHDVSRHCTRAPGYHNLLEAMEFTDPIVANCLIDQQNIECVLLIPTSSEACEMLSDVRKVPRNCKKALTQRGDTFFPDPKYRSYGGKCGVTAKFLQVSTKDAIKASEEELVSMEAERMTIINQYKQVQEDLKSAKQELDNITKHVSMLRSSQVKMKTAENELLDRCQIDETNSVAAFTADLNELLKKVERDTDEAKKLKDEITELEQEVKSVEAEVKRYRELAHCLDMKLEPIKKLIREQENEMQTIHANSQYGERKLLDAQQALQKVTAELEKQERITGKAVADAVELCPRINTRRSAREINETMEELKANIKQIEEQWGSKEVIIATLADKRAKYENQQEFASSIKITNDEHLKRLEGRRREYNTMKRTIGWKVQSAFQSVLELRKYNGKLKIDYNDKLLTLEVNPAGDAKRTTTDTRSLSGGERSYSTVAFILALWDSVALPFYFLDEFDVFMDKVNRRIIMDILLDHTRSHPAHQFAFLTPLDTSNIVADEFITIHQLAPPERSADRV